MPGKLAKNKKIGEGQRAHAVKVLSSVNEVLSEYDGSRGAKDNITRLSIALNEKLVTLKALDESILCAVDDGEIESEIEESENFRAQIHEALVKLQTRGGTPRDSWWGCAARVFKSRPYFRPKHAIFHTHFQT